MTCSVYTAPTTVRMTAGFKTSAGTMVDPTTVTCKLTLPDGTVVDLTSVVVRDSVGNYHADYLASVRGVYKYEFLGAGAFQVAETGQFTVDKVAFT